MSARVPMVEPRRARVTAGVAPLFAEPREDAERVDEVCVGDSVMLLAARGGWSYVEDRSPYFGWIRDAHLGPAEDPDARMVVATLTAALRERPDAAAAIVDLLAAGTRLEIRERTGDWLHLTHGGWLSCAHAAAATELPHRSPTSADIIATAHAYMGVPYLWGGATGDGIDCSGLTQQVYRLNGVVLPRDADQQALVGRRVTEAGEGDLLFFGAAEITHVAISLGGNEFLHAPQDNGRVERSSLATSGRELRLTRRYLP